MPFRVGVIECDSEDEAIKLAGRIEELMDTKRTPPRGRRRKKKRASKRTKNPGRPAATTTRPRRETPTPPLAIEPPRAAEAKRLYEELARITNGNIDPHKASIVILQTLEEQGEVLAGQLAALLKRKPQHVGRIGVYVHSFLAEKKKDPTKYFHIETRPGGKRTWVKTGLTKNLVAWLMKETPTDEQIKIRQRTR